MEGYARIERDALALLNMVREYKHRVDHVWPVTCRWDEAEKVSADIVRAAMDLRWHCEDFAKTTKGMRLPE